METRPILSALLRNKTGPLLVAVQVALSLAILANAIHIVHERQAVAARASGVADERHVFTLNVSHLQPGGHQEQLATQRREAALLRAVPGVLSVADVSQTPLSRSSTVMGVSADRRQTAVSSQSTLYVSPDSLIKTWGLRLVEGRDFLPNDIVEIDTTSDTTLPPTTIITRALAAKLWPGAVSVLGKTMYIGLGETAPALRIVGVVEQLQSPAAQPGIRGEMSLLLPARRTGYDNSDYTVRAEPGQLDRVIAAAQAAIRAAAPTPVILRVKTMIEYRTERYRADVALGWMLVTVSVLLLLVTASGIVGMASLWVTQRRKQIGVRRALGARRVDILRYFVTENLIITSVGVAAGVLLALGLNQLLVSQLEMARLPAGYLVAGAAVFWALGVAAVYGPAWRAASISPATATRGV
ncbi:MAG TPA: FtsX-like permease family protein [Duganella sp.]|jgi:putative ABC transport system permease protein